MKFAENSILEALTIFLTERDMGISTLNGKMIILLLLILILISIILQLKEKSNRFH